MPAIYIVTGIMAAGKSTVAQILAEKLPKAVHLRGDVFRRMVVSGREDMTADPSGEALRQLHLRYDLAAACAEMYHAAGFDVVLQDIYIGDVLPGVLARITAQPLHLTILCPDPVTVANRETDRPKTGYGGGFTPHNMHEMMLRQTPRIGLWLDTSDMTAEQSAQAILENASCGNGFIPH